MKNALPLAMTMGDASGIGPEIVAKVLAQAEERVVVFGSQAVMEDIVDRLGLDGAHLADGPRSVRRVRADLGPDAIVGAFCGGSRHDGMSAGELGADYVAFGPVSGATPPADADLFAWWSEMIEVPVIAEGSLDEALIRALSPVTDFFALGPEVWAAPDPIARLIALDAAIGQG